MKTPNTLSQESRDWADDVATRMDREYKLLAFWQKALEDGQQRTEIGCWLRWGHTKKGLQCKVAKLRRAFILGKT